MTLNLQAENQLKQQGYQYIAGLDEVGRGSWAGPLVAAAIIFDPQKKYITQLWKKINSSKRITARQRNLLSSMIIKQAMSYGIGIISEKEIDQIGLGPANQLVMIRAIQHLSVQPDYLLIDGQIKLAQINLAKQSIIKGDEKILSIAAASIVAKVWRDHWMVTVAHQHYPQYLFDHHKGYGTKKHLELIKQYGVCPLHRRSFKPIRQLVNNKSFGKESSF